jgi:hypothetical protein
MFFVGCFFVLYFILIFILCVNVCVYTCDCVCMLAHAAGSSISSDKRLAWHGYCSPDGIGLRDGRDNREKAVAGEVWPLGKSGLGTVGTTARRRWSEKSGFLAVA